MAHRSFCLQFAILAEERDFENGWKWKEFNLSRVRDLDLDLRSGHTALIRCLGQRASIVASVLCEYCPLVWCQVHCIYMVNNIQSKLSHWLAFVVHLSVSEWCCGRLIICLMIWEKLWVLVADLLTFRWPWAGGLRNHVFLMVMQPMTTLLVCHILFLSDHSTVNCTLLLAHRGLGLCF